jgi:lipoate-protein ligase A
VDSRTYPPIERYIPFRTYSGFEVSALLEVLVEGVRSGISPTTVFFAGFKPYTLAISRNQKITDINQEACHKKGIDIVYFPRGAKAFLNTSCELYMAVIGKPSNAPLDITGHYKFVGDHIVRALKPYGVDAQSVSREIDGVQYGVDVKIRDGHDVKETANLKDPYYVGMLAALSSVYQSKEVFARHGAIFVHPYERGDVETMFKCMNVPTSVDRLEGMERILKYSSYLQKYNSNVSRASLAESLATSFQAKKGEWSEAELVQAREKIEKINLAKRNGDYYYDDNLAKSMGLCMYNWGEKFKS